MQEDGGLRDPDRFTGAAQQAASGKPIDRDLIFAWTARKVITSMAGRRSRTSSQPLPSFWPSCPRRSLPLFTQVFHMRFGCYDLE
jgi:hypothetical protein